MLSQPVKAEPTENQRYSNRAVTYAELDLIQLIIVIINFICTNVNKLNKRFFHSLLRFGFEDTSTDTYNLSTLCFRMTRGLPVPSDLYELQL